MRGDVVEVKKRSGKTEPFDEAKLRKSIKKAIVDAGAAVEEKGELVENVLKETVEAVKQKGEVSTGFLRETVLGALDKADATVSSAWRAFDKKYKGR
ncbi:transcriptional regulator [Candidatus Micrarchaeota archaeon]|nr:MAG: transcriptional regulator [Candidatus Micrarchaeota archaeon]